jgi:glucose/arabinose dehydrogenase
MTFKKTCSIMALGLSALGLQSAFAWTYSSPTAVGTCGNLDESGSTSDFTFTSVVNRSLFASPGVSDVLKMAFVMPTDTSTHADIIFVERFGAVKYYNALAKTLTLIGTVPGVGTSTEDGLMAVGVERPFKNRVFVAYSRGTGSANNAISGSFRLSRFTMNATTRMMDMASEHVLIDVPSVRNRWHTAGGISFDNAGNLYWSIGDNETAFTGPANTNDLRGSIIRIKPNDGPGYTIPPGNFGAYWAGKFREQGRTALAAKYEDTTKVKSQIFIKGTRNVYTFSVVPSRPQVTFSQCGPDYGGDSEVHNNTLAPIFQGFPYWAGTTSVQSSLLSGSQYGKNGAAEPTTATWANFAPTNKSNPTNTWTGTMSGTPGPGVDTLPPYTNPKYSYGRSCAMGSLIVRYDGRVKNPGKMPPQMDNVWLMGDYNNKKLRTAKVDSSGNIVGTVATAGMFTANLGAANGINALVDLQQGPDGAIYVANLSCNGGSASGSTKYSDGCSGILRIEYKGAACSDPNLYPRGSMTDPTGVFGGMTRIDRGSVDWVRIASNHFSVIAEGTHAIRFLDMQGKVVASMQGEGEKQYALPSNLAQRTLYVLEVRSSRGVNVRGFFNP